MNNKPSKYIRILVYKNRKTDDMFWLASTPEETIAAFQALFAVLRDWGVYNDLKDAEDDLKDARKELDEAKAMRAKLMEDGEPKGAAVHILFDVDIMIKNVGDKVREAEKGLRFSRLYNKALAGDFTALYALLAERKDYEYEEWDYGYVSREFMQDSKLTSKMLKSYAALTPEYVKRMEAEIERWQNRR